MEHGRADRRRRSGATSAGEPAPGGPAPGGPAPGARQRADAASGGRGGTTPCGQVRRLRAAVRARPLAAGGAAGSLAGAALYAWFAASTTPFTTAANVMTAIPLAVLAGIYVLQLCAPDGGPWRRLPSSRPVRRGRATGWFVVVGVVTASELSSYFAGARAAHPTLSSTLDAAFRSHPAKAAAFLAWLIVAWYLVRR